MRDTPKMSTILSIETSTTVCSAALHSEGKLIASEITHVANSAASQLAVMIDKLLGSSSRVPGAVAVTSGPGSYTGLRIGVATAKGICYALGLPLIAVSSLEVMAAQVNSLLDNSSFDSRNSLLCPMIDARRMEVYTALYDGGLNVVEGIQARVIDASAYIDVLGVRPVVFFGNGSDKCKDVIRHSNARFVEGIFPSADWLGKIAFERFAQERFEDVGEFEPFYLKDFIAKKPKSLV
jgi:tRNA threonylcarbamoyladenosine biosynthesis protein TsaB